MRQHEWKHRQAQAPQEPAPVLLAALSPGPAQWLAGPGAWAAAAPLLRALPQPLGLAGESGLLRLFRKALTEAWLENGVELVLLNLPDGVECCRKTAEALLREVRAKHCGALLGLGGGKLLDTAKWVAQEGGLPLVTVPTSAATCAAASGVVAVHGQDGSFESVLDLDRPAQLCIVDLDVLAQAPPRLLAAGMADTLAKWLEWRALEDGPGSFGAAAGWALAEKAALVCEALGAEALRQPGSAAWATCVEACLLWSAQASCLGQAPAAAAHSLANALTRQAAGRNLLHGEQVGLGLLWQEALLSKSTPVWGFERVRRALYAWGLPTNLPGDLDRGFLVETALGPDESVHSLSLEADAASAASALEALTL
jgi:glycerol dehydrogenase-like iron-containing ADH family enzyme